MKGPDVSPAWNPKTGAQIAFVSGRTGLPQIYVMDSDGSNVQRVTDTGYAVSPSWSPNGQFLLFSWIRRYGPGAPGGEDIYIMDVASHQWVQLTHDGGRNDFPSWAPDGRHIVFQSNRSGSEQIWTMLADGSQQRQLTTAEGILSQTGAHTDGHPNSRKTASVGNPGPSTFVRPVVLRLGLSRLVCLQRRLFALCAFLTLLKRCAARGHRPLHREISRMEDVVNQGNRKWFFVVLALAAMLMVTACKKKVAPAPPPPPPPPAAAPTASLTANPATIQPGQSTHTHVDDAERHRSHAGRDRQGRPVRFAVGDARDFDDVSADR